MVFVVQYDLDACVLWPLCLVWSSLWNLLYVFCHAPWMTKKGIKKRAPCCISLPVILLSAICHVVSVCLIHHFTIGIASVRKLQPSIILHLLSQQWKFVLHVHCCEVLIGYWCKKKERKKHVKVCILFQSHNPFTYFIQVSQQVWEVKSDFELRNLHWGAMWFWTTRTFLSCTKLNKMENSTPGSDRFWGRIKFLNKMSTPHFLSKKTVLLTKYMWSYTYILPLPPIIYLEKCPKYDTLHCMVWYKAKKT